MNYAPNKILYALSNESDAARLWRWKRLRLFVVRLISSPQRCENPQTVTPADHCSFPQCRRRRGLPAQEEAFRRVQQRRYVFNVRYGCSVL